METVILRDWMEEVNRKDWINNELNSVFLGNANLYSCFYKCKKCLTFYFTKHLQLNRTRFAH